MQVRRCDEIANQEYLLGVLTPSEAALLEEHLHTCDACTRQVEEFRALFTGLAEMPEPPVPEGIADHVLLRLAELARSDAALVRQVSARHETWFDRLVRRFGLPDAAGRPLAAAFSGAISGGVVAILLAFFHEPLFLFFGRLTHGFLTNGSIGLTAGLGFALKDLLDMTVLLHTFIDAITKLGLLSQQFSAMARSDAFATTAIASFAMFLAIAFVIGRVIGHPGREKLGHAKN
jgi:hypothetical protein